MEAEGEEVSILGMITSKLIAAFFSIEPSNRLRLRTLRWLLLRLWDTSEIVPSEGRLNLYEHRYDNAAVSHSACAALNCSKTTPLFEAK